MAKDDGQGDCGSDKNSGARLRVATARSTVPVVIGWGNTRAGRAECRPTIPHFVIIAVAPEEPRPQFACR
jgi:hypothetical protein